MSFQLSVIIAVHGAEANVAAILAALRPASFPQVEFLLCAPAPAAAALPRPDGDNLVLIECAADALVPHMWRDGVRACHAKRVAFSSAHCIPAADWLSQALGADLDSHVGVGGSIDQADAADACDWAIYFQRYARFCSRRPAGLTDEIAADNAVYRRADIMRHHDLLESGFWEPSFHRRFAADQQRLWFEPAMNMTHHNRYSRTCFFSQRMAHGMAFGRERCRHFSTARRAAAIVLSPLIPLVFGLKLYRQAGCIEHPRTRFLRASGCLAWFLAGWSIGECKGYCKGNSA